MFLNRLAISIVVVALCFSFPTGADAVALVKGTIHVTATGSGTYFPATGLYIANGETDPFGQSVGTGRVEAEQTGQTTFSFQNWGRGTNEEFLERIVVTDGSMFLRMNPGTLELFPVLSDPNFDPLVGPYTAEWLTISRLVRGSGTGRFRGAKGAVTVTATNLPFLLTDSEWQFTWTWDGEFSIPPRR